MLCVLIKAALKADEGQRLFSCARCRGVCVCSNAGPRLSSAVGVSNSMKDHELSLKPDSLGGYGGQRSRHAMCAFDQQTAQISNADSQRQLQDEVQAQCCCGQEALVDVRARIVAHVQRLELWPVPELGLERQRPWRPDLTLL